MAKLVLNDVANLRDYVTAQTTINNNWAAIETAVENTLSRDGTSPNQMIANLDMNSRNIINLPYPATAQSPVRLMDVITSGSGIGIPSGGSADNVLAKTSGVDYEVAWKANTGTGNVVLATSPTFTTRITTPNITGGSAAGSGLVFQTTTGNGSGDAFTWLRGNNGATTAMSLGTAFTVNTPSIINAGSLAASTYGLYINGTGALTSGVQTLNRLLFSRTTSSGGGDTFTGLFGIITDSGTVNGNIQAIRLTTTMSNPNNTSVFNSNYLADVTVNENTTAFSHLDIYSAVASGKTLGTVYGIRINAPTGSGTITNKIAFQSATNSGDMSVGDKIGAGIGPSTAVGRVASVADASTAISYDSIGRSADSVSIIRFTNNAVNTEYGRFDARNAGLTFSANGSRYLDFQTNGTDRMVIAASGDINIAATTASASYLTGALTVNGGIGVGGFSVFGSANAGGLGVGVTPSSGGGFSGAGKFTVLNTLASTTTLAAEGNSARFIVGYQNNANTYNDGASFIWRQNASPYTTGMDYTAPVAAALSAGGLHIYHTTSSTLTTNGALIVDGGVGIAGGLNVGGHQVGGGVIQCTQGFLMGAPVTKTGTSGTMAATDNYIIFNPSGTYTATLSNPASFTGKMIFIKNITANAVNSASSNVVPLGGGAAGTTLCAANKWVIIASNGTNWEIMAGN